MIDGGGGKRLLIVGKTPRSTRSCEVSLSDSLTIPHSLPLSDPMTIGRNPCRVGEEEE